MPENDDWTRVGEYLDRLAFENDRLEADLKIKKERRLNRERAEQVTTPVASHSTTARQFDEVAATRTYEIQSASDATHGMHASYDALKRDLSGLMSDLNDFKHTRAGLESRLQS